MKQFYIFIFFILSFQLYAQNDLQIINGIVSSDSIAIENVHIINISSNRGTISNNFGEFKISVKINDKINFSNIQFENKTIIINKDHLENSFINVQLFQKTNKLKEIVVIQSNNMAKSLGLPNADKIPLNKLERNLNYYSQESVAVVILATLLGQQGGIDDIYNIISGNRKRDRELKYLLDEDKINKITKEYIINIRDHFQDDFFINTLEIPKEDINVFLNYCLPKDIMFLFDKNRYLDLIDVFIIESKAFKNN